jgi:hypothetical protein
MRLGLLHTHNVDPFDREFLSADESRDDKAYRAIEGEEDPWWKNNPWEPIHEFGGTLNAQIQANGGLVLDVSLGNESWLIPNQTTRLAVLWDDEVLAFGPVQVEIGSRFAIPIPRVAGANLSVWCTDSLALRINERRPMRELSDVENRITLDEQEQERAPNALERIGRKYATSASVAGTAVLVVVAVGAYLYLKGR